MSENTLAPLVRLAISLHQEGRIDDAELLLRELSTLDPKRLDYREVLVEMAIARGDTLDALHAILRLMEAGVPSEMAVERFQSLIETAFAECQKFYDRQDGAQAETYLEPLSRIMPNHLGVQAMALTCSRHLGNTERSEMLMRRVLALDPRNGEARMEMVDHYNRIGDREAEADWRHLLVTTMPVTIPRLNYMWQAYELINMTICEPLSERSRTRIREAQQALAGMEHDDQALTGTDAWIAFTNAMVGGIELDTLDRPPAPPAITPRLASGDGTPMTIEDARALASRQGAEVIFMVAADEVYASRYAALYVRSVLRNAGLKVLVLVHIAGGVSRIAEIAAAIGVSDERLIFSIDDFDPSTITNRVLDAPSQPRSTKPTAHYQSVRFHQIPWILSELKLPLIVTDIDCLLERDVRDLVGLDGTTDFLLNENTVMRQLGARITANLLMFFPTPNALRFAEFVSGYLTETLKRRDIPKFIDQIALLVARHYMQLHHPEVRIGYFDVETDINNCIFMSYYLHPFRFLSLYQGFDLTSLPSYQEP